MVSRPDGNLTYSEWMSDAGGWGRIVEASGGPTVITTAPQSALQLATFTLLHQPPPTSTDLVSIAHPPDPIARVIAHKQRSIRQHQQTDRSAPARAVSELPPRDEVFAPRRSPAGDMHADDLRSRRHGTVPGTVVRHERIAPIVGGEKRACIEREPERCRVRLNGQRRRLDAGAVESTVLRI